MITTSVNSLSSSVTKSSDYSSTQSSNKWLLANNDTDAGLCTISSCVCLADILADGDYKLIIADFGLNNTATNAKLKVYRGTALQSENVLVDIPSGIAAFYTNSSDPHIPAVAVSSGSFLYIYKNFKPFYKFSLPTLDVNSAESEAWTQARNDAIDVLALKETLTNIRLEIGDTCMTSRSQAYLMINDVSQMDSFVSTYKNQPLRRMTVITCVTTIKKTVTDENAVSCLVLATENRDIFILEPEAFTILVSATLPSVPVFMEVNGLFDVEYRILVSCRDAHIYTIKRGYKTGRLGVQLNSQPVGLLRVNNNVVIASMDQTLSSYTSKGNCLWSVKQPNSITCLEAIDVEILGLRLIAVGLDNKQVHLYNDKNRVDILEMDDTIVAMKFGRFGREDNSLVMISRKGYLTVKILKRTAKFSTKEIIESPVIGSNSKLVIPKKTKLFVDQTMREREQSIIIHRTFQHDLYKMKLIAARTYVKAITTCLNPLSTNSTDPLKLSAQVHGLGPIFRLTLQLQNTSIDQPSMDLFITFHSDIMIYKIDRSVIPVPYLVPGISYTFATRVECVSQLNVSDIIKVYVLKEDDIIPLITAVINMPNSEAPI